ncbi:quinon protein alcohol dehydrogenase-like superfamily [Blyttiomyces helicus]|uniref:Quinon protein alcohol dehydrogenase-like superfamily n=1 Tax=Blyttiomyces helicus TaxID=388810 RepID=A0A4P9WGA0_9FUNG|nr:quinon protein alcohol dehydrogenase-like superfamily [Blyttiomyces helicus]|eukprot:RKO90935.1 quinon protein alcohol dehydrogenase-like superfamily [Blyttiomyces helicus]
MGNIPSSKPSSPPPQQPVGSPPGNALPEGNPPAFENAPEPPAYPTTAPDLLFVACLTTLLAIDKRTGAEHWRFNLPGELWHLASVIASIDGALLYVGWLNTLAVLDSSTGKVVSSCDCYGDAKDDVLVLPVGAEVEVEQGSEAAAPAPWVFVGQENRVRALEARTGETLWTYDIDPARASVAGQRTPALLYEDGVLFCAVDAAVVALDPRTGRELWKTFPEKIRASNMSLATVETRSGQLAGDIRSEAQRNIIGVAINGSVLAVDKSTGDIVWKNSLRGLGSGEVILAGGGEFFYAGTHGRVQTVATLQGGDSWRSEVISRRPIPPMPMPPRRRRQRRPAIPTPPQPILPPHFPTRHINRHQLAVRDHEEVRVVDERVGGACAGAELAILPGEVVDVVGVDGADYAA